MSLTKIHSEDRQRYSSEADLNEFYNSIFSSEVENSRKLSESFTKTDSEKHNSEESDSESKSETDTKSIPFYKKYLQISLNPEFIELLLKLDTEYHRQIISKQETYNTALTDLENAQLSILANIQIQHQTADDINEINQRLVINRENLIKMNVEELTEYKKSCVKEWRETVKKLFFEEKGFIGHLKARINGGNFEGGDTLMFGNRMTKLKSINKDDFDLCHDQNLDSFDEYFSVTIGHQLKTQHNIRVLRGDIIHTYGNYSLEFRQEERLNSFSGIYRVDPTSAFFIDEVGGKKKEASLKKRLETVADKYPEYHFGSDRECEVGLSFVKDKHEEGSYFTRYSNLSKIDGVFWMKAKRREILQPLYQHHPVLKQLHVGYDSELNLFLFFILFVYQNQQFHYFSEVKTKSQS